MRTSPARSDPISPLYLLYISPVSPLGEDFSYTIRPWEGGDKVRLKRMDSVFVDIFTLRRYESFEQLHELIGVKKNGQPQSDEYVAGIRSTIETSAFSQGEVAPLCPFWHFNTRKAVEMWPKEVYREALTLTLSLIFTLTLSLTLTLTLTLTPSRRGSQRPSTQLRCSRWAHPNPKP